ncbi:uncharacterized protein A4U43_C07F3890 [Asparagus officinalis]|uniref:Exonuclease V, chloroplastic n=1 Tax=Asparagus officinalis TaxID=4686 RepID=A0A5P1ECI9_ASPOF|nr:exonuclease V, chloroplastic [Asparagus officinalis]ONK62441.1 uncharacterized protein A4U43_C07F3890 [Asparagus officinalis]
MEPKSPPSHSSSPSAQSRSIPVETEIITDAEMAFLDAALASARPLLSSSILPPSRFPLLPCSLPLALSSPPRHVTSLSCSSGSSSPVKDIEDADKSVRPKSLLERFRARRGLMVTDITSSEWCQKKTEFGLVKGKPKKTAAMEAGSNRHAALEKEVVERVEIPTESLEEIWAVKFFNFIVGAKQLLLEGLTREVPVIGVFGGTWIVGVIDEVRMPLNEASLNPILVDIKTRYKATPPTEAQKRNARLQVMLYKYLWDGLAASNFPTAYFYKHFKLDPHYILSEDVKRYAASLRFDVKTLEDVVTGFTDSCSFLCPSTDQLLLRYELQSDCSLLEEHWFRYDVCWLKDQMEEILKFWSGGKEATYVSEAESWKCRFCEFNDVCPITSSSSPEQR